MVRYYWLHKVTEIFKQPRLEWIDNDIRKRFILSINKHTNVSTPSSSQCNISSTYQLNSTRIGNKLVKNPSSINGLIPLQLLNKFSYSPVKIRIPINVTKFGNVGYRFQKHFKGFGIYEGRVIEIRSNMKGNKNRRCMYSDGDKEDLSLK